MLRGSIYRSCDTLWLCRGAEVPFVISSRAFRVLFFLPHPFQISCFFDQPRYSLPIATSPTIPFRPNLAMVPLFSSNRFSISLSPKPFSSLSMSACRINTTSKNSFPLNPLLPIWLNSNSAASDNRVRASITCMAGFIAGDGYKCCCGGPEDPCSGSKVDVWE
jgi:hypothetical protein